MTSNAPLSDNLAFAAPALRGLLHAIVYACATLCSAFLQVPTARAEVAAQPASVPPAGETPVTYRRVFVPADTPDAWPRDGAKYIPVESRDFNEWVGRANQGSAHDAKPTIAAAEYTARLEDDGRFHGHGHWDITVEGDQPSFLPLPNLTLVIRDARWQHAPNEPARLGVWGTSDGEPDRLGVEVLRSGVLDFEWSNPTKSQQDVTEVPWQLPTATSARVILDLPATKEPLVAGGVVLDSTKLPPDSMTNPKPRRRWVLAISPSSDPTLRIINAGREAAASTNQLSLREEVSYRVEQRGLEVSATWHLDGEINQQRELSVPLPRGTQLISATSAGHDLSWRLARAATPATDKAIITMPDTGDARSLQVIIRAWQPLVVDKPWQLPVLRPEGVFWNSGKITLAIASEFELHSLNPIDCVQSGVNQVAENQANAETYSLSSFTPTASQEITVARRQPDTTIRTGASLVLADPDVTGRLVTDWRVTHSSLHRLSGDLAAGWNVETVETIPADAMAEWYIDRRGNHRRLEIQLTDAASPGRSVSVIVMGRLQRFNPSEPIPTDTLRMVNWTGARAARNLLTFQSTEPYTVESVGDLPFLNRESITDSDRTLLDPTADETRIVDLTQATKNAGLQLTLKRGQYAAEVDVETDLVKGELRQNYRLVVRTKANPIDRVLVYSTLPLADNVRWTEKSTEQPIVAERLPADDPLHKNLPKDGEAWLVRLPQSTAGVIEIGATATSPWAKRAALPLLVLPEATEQQGRVAIRGEITNSPPVDPEGLNIVPLPLSEPATSLADSRQPVRAAFRFSPTDCLDPSHTPRLWVGPATSSGTTALTAQHLELESYIWPDGRATHRATYQLENYGASEFKPILPPDARLTAVFVNGKSLDSAIPSEGRSRSPIRLPSQARSATVSLYFETQQAPLTSGGRIAPALPQNAIPTLAAEWTVWLPDGYSAGAADLSTGTAYSWRERIFGPLGRATNSAPFHPLSPADWAHLINGMADWQSNPTAPPQSLPSDQAAIDSSTRTASTDAVSDGQRAGATVSQANTFSPSNDAFAPLPGWHAYRETFVADGELDPIVVSHPAAIAAWAVAALLACLLFGHHFLRGRATLAVTLLAIAASLALVLPAEFAPVATGGLWGLALSTLTLLRRPTPADAPSSRRAKQVAAGALALLFVIGLSNLAFAEPAEPLSSTHSVGAPPTIERVLIPVDASKQPVGSKYYVSEQFLRKLLGPVAQQTSVDTQWLLRSANYTGELTDNHGRADIAAGDWALAFSIETLARNTTILLPLIESEAAWQPTAMLDGVPAPLAWRDDGRKCAIEVAEPGQYTLTLYCVPKTLSTDDGSQFTLTIPPLLSAAVHLTAPPLLSAVKISNADVAPPAKEALGITSGDLEQTDRLSVHWPRLEAKANTSQGLGVTAMSWLKVGTAGAELETKYVIEGGARRPETLTIEYDDHWQPLIKPGPRAKDSARDTAKRRRVLQIPLPAEGIDRQEVSLRWRLADAPTAGIFRLPPIELTSIPTTQHWFALSSDPSLDCTVTDSTASSTTAKEFLAKWGGTTATTMPQVVLANLDASHVWTLAVRPRETDSIVHDVLHVAAGKNALRIVYQANVTPGTANKYQYRLSVPAGMSVDEVTVAEADREIPARWTRDAENHVNVFFSEEATSEYRLTLSGTVPVDAKASVLLPRIVAPSSTSSTQQLQLYRDDDVGVALDGFPVADESKTGPIDLPPIQWLVRPLGVFHLDEAAAKSARLTVTPTRLKLAGDTLTALTRETGAWWATLRCHLTVERGELDVLRLHIPPTWTGPFEVESRVAAATEMSQANERSRTLAIRFASTIAEGSEIDLQIRGPLTLSAGSPAEVPDIAVQSLEHGNRYISVPTSLDSQPIAWTDAGVQAEKIPLSLLRASTDTVKRAEFKVTKDSFQVAIRARSTTQPVPQVRLADTAVTAGQHGGQLISTRLILDSNGLSTCTLQLPPGQELLSVALDGHPALISPQSASHWQLALGAAQLPQAVEIVSRSAEPELDDQPRELRRPSLLDSGKPIPVEVSLWSFSHPDGLERTKIEGAAAVSAMDHAALRLDRLVSIAEAATTAAAEAPRPDGANWFRPWDALLQSVEDQTRRIIAQPTASTSVAQASRSAEEQIRLATQRLEKWRRQSTDLLSDADASQLPQGSVPASQQIASGTLFNNASAGQSTTYYVADGGADRLSLRVIPTAATSRQIQVLGLLVIIGLTTASAWFLRSPAAADFFCRWPHALGIALGFAYWAWLWPSWLGLVIAAASLWFALRFNWPGRSLRPEASTVLRSTRTQ